MSVSNWDAESSSAQNDLILENFKKVTGANDENAKAILEACSWNLEMACNLHAEGIDIEPTGNNWIAINLNEPSSEPEHFDSLDFLCRIPDPSLSIPSISPVRKQLVGDNFSSVDKKRTLEDLFEPPLDLMFLGTLEACKAEGTELNKWLLVDVHDSREFACRVLNRDVWSNSTVRDIIKDRFIFWQTYPGQLDGQRFIQLYGVHEYPHVSILNPRTGEQLRTFSAPRNSDRLNEFVEFIIEFLNEHPTPNEN